jgi:hypothetical protein
MDAIGRAVAPWALAILSLAAGGLFLSCQSAKIPSADPGPATVAATGDTFHGNAVGHVRQTSALVASAPAGFIRQELENGIVLEVERGRLYRILRRGEFPNPAPPLTPALQKRHAQLAKRLRELTSGPNQAEHQDEIRWLLDELNAPEFRTATAWELDGYHYWGIEGREKPPRSEAIVIDLRAENAPTSGPGWRVVGQRK